MTPAEYAKLFQTERRRGQPDPDPRDAARHRDHAQRAGARATHDPRRRRRHAADRGDGLPAPRPHGRTRRSDHDLLGASGDGVDAGPDLGMSRLDRHARVGDCPLRREHLVHRGAARRRNAARSSTQAPACERSASPCVEDPPARIDLLLTHLHVDHVEGLGAFEPIWRPQTDLHIWGPASPVASLDERIATYFSPPLFPIHLSEVPARCTFHDAPDEPWSIGGARLRSGIRSSTPVRRSATGSRPTGRCSPTSPTMSPPSA